MTVLGIYTAGAVEAAVIAGKQEAAATSDGAALESLVPLITHALASVKRSFDDLSLVGVCTGPGSFTGLRIGAAFGKSLAQARDLPIVGVSSYDVVSFGTHSYPLVAVARGKPGYYYARLAETPNATARYVQGGRAVIEQAALGLAPAVATIVGPDFSPSAPGALALAVAKLAQQAFELDAAVRWADIAIDYGQRPNAVVNWERRRASQEEPQVYRREPTTQ